MTHSFDALAISESLRARVSQVLDAIRAELVRIGLELEALAWESPSLSVRRVPNDDCEALFGVWEARAGQRMGCWMMRSDGEGFADMDVLVRHPAFPTLLVESVSAFAAGSTVGARAHLCPL